MKRALTPLHLGGSLYLNAGHKNLEPILLSDKYPFLKSIIIDFEDALLDADLLESEKRVMALIKAFKLQATAIFIRPRDEAQLKRLLRAERIDKIDGFVIPKVRPQKLENYMNLIDKAPFWLMPVLEDRTMLHPLKRVALFESLAKYKKDILTLRLGVEDLSQYLNIQRNCQGSLHDYPLLLSIALALLELAAFYGFNLTAPVYPCYEEDQGFLENCIFEKSCGFFGKTVIHPKQVERLNHFYQVTASERSKAEAIVASMQSIDTFEGMMLEKSVHQHWAEKILAQGAIYGYC